MEPNDMSAVAAALREHERFVVTSHDNPDGDAIGSLLALHLALRQLGKDSVMVIGGATPLPARVRVPRARASTGCSASRPRTSASACSSQSTVRRRAGSPSRRCSRAAPLTINIDHHHDNTRFGDIDLVVGATRRPPARCSPTSSSCSACELTPAIAEALYTALVTDTGRFQYSNTTPKALRLAADLVEAGADSSRVFVEVYESTPFAKLKLLARALERARSFVGRPRRRLGARPRRTSRTPTADEPSSEGVIDHLRSVEGAELVALIRELPNGAASARKGSLRSRPRRGRRLRDRTELRRGGHRRAAGFSTDLSMDEIVRRIVDAFVASRRRPRRLMGIPKALEPTGVILADKPAGPSSFAIVARVRATDGREDRPRRHARPVRDRACSSSSRDGRRASRTVS